jgi:hypothetical protein
MTHATTTSAILAASSRRRGLTFRSTQKADWSRGISAEHKCGMQSLFHRNVLLQISEPVEDDIYLRLVGLAVRPGRQ